MKGASGLMTGTKRNKKEIFCLKSEQGYLMLTTLFLLMLSGIMTQSLIKISTNHIIQLNEISASYEAKAALNVAENLLREQLKADNSSIQKGKIVTSHGEILIEKQAETKYQLCLTTADKKTYQKDVKIDPPPPLESEETLEPEESEETVKSSEPEETINSATVE